MPGHCELAICPVGFPLSPAHLQSQAKGLQLCVSCGKCPVTGHTYAYLGVLPITTNSFLFWDSLEGLFSQGTAWQRTAEGTW